MSLPLISGAQSATNDTTVCFTLKEAVVIAQKLSDCETYKEQVYVRGLIIEEQRQMISIIQPKVIMLEEEKYKLTNDLNKSKNRYANLRKQTLLYSAGAFIIGGITAYYILQ